MCVDKPWKVAQSDPLQVHILFQCILYATEKRLYLELDVLQQLLLWSNKTTTYTYPYNPSYDLFQGPEHGSSRSELIYNVEILSVILTVPGKSLLQ